jgi:SAM-dependent methyltransferase
VILLGDGDKTATEIAEGFARFWHHFGFFGREETLAGRALDAFIAALQETLEELERQDLVVKHGEVYSLTARGRQQAEGMRKGFQWWRRWSEWFLHPQTVSLVGLGVHIVLAVFKLIAGAMSGSIGLINDGIDTAMDGFSSVLVFVGLRLKVERYVNVVLVLLMLGVGVAAGYEAVRRLFIPEGIGVDLLTFAAAIVSGLTCWLLSLYQRHVATRSGQQALISQAVDSRNHTIVAAGVVAGLVATLLRFPLMDTLVGLAVAAIILRSGVELALETVRALRGEEVDLSRYELSFVEEHRRFQQRQLGNWLLSVVAEEGPVLSEGEGPLTRSALLAHCQETLDVRDVPFLREVGWGIGARLEKQVTGALKTLVERGLVVSEGDELQITEQGRVELGQEAWGVEEVDAYAQAMERATRWIHAPLARRIIDSLPSLPENPLIVDVGTGPGFLCVELAKLVPGATFIGVDPSPQAVGTAQQITAKAGVERFEARLGRVEQMPVDSGVADLVVSWASLHEWEDAEAGCAEIHRVLRCPELAEGKPGGFLALEDWNRASPRWKRRLLTLLITVTSGRRSAQGQSLSYATAFTPEEIEELLECSGFEVVKSEAGLSLFLLAVKRSHRPFDSTQDAPVQEHLI